MVAEMLKNKEMVLRKLCKEPVLYFEAHNLLRKEKEAEDVCIAALKAMIEMYPLLQEKSYHDLLCIFRISIQYRCAMNLGLVSERNAEDIKNAPSTGEEHFHTLICDCGSDALLQVLKELPLDKRCILMLKYVFGLDADIIRSLLDVSHCQVLKELETAERIMAASLFPQSVSTACCNKTEAYRSYQTGS